MSEALRPRYPTRMPTILDGAARRRRRARRLSAPVGAFLLLAAVHLAPVPGRTAEAPCAPVALHARLEPSLPPRRVCIPPEYVNYPLTEPRHTDLALTAVWPSMRGYYTPGWDVPGARPRDPETWSGALQILFGPVRSYPDIRFRFEARRKDTRADVPAGEAHGLERLAIAPDALRPGQRPSELYVRDGGGDDFIWIACDLPRPGRSPGCRTEFVADGYLVGVSFSRVFLPRWRDIQDSTRRLIAGFER